MSIFHLAASCLGRRRGCRDEWGGFSNPPPVAVIIIIEQPRFLKICREKREQATQRKLIDLENWDRLCLWPFLEHSVGMAGRWTRTKRGWGGEVGEGGKKKAVAVERVRRDACCHFLFLIFFATLSLWILAKINRIIIFIIIII